ncbi:MAG: DUF2891 domain-containing protein [Sulfuricaulis sp.]|nr:DUF2891 domain-containing protein [Sulfuricaulis sp.]
MSEKDAVRRLGAMLLAATCAFVVAGAAAEPKDPLRDFLSRRGRVATALTEPIAACVARKDTDHPVFRGCIDWHSSVHGTWALTAYTWAVKDQRYRSLIEKTLDPQRLEREREYMRRHPRFEMPYGRAWFLRLAIDHQRTFKNKLLIPFADEVAQSLVDYYTATPPDPESLAYDNASWALINLYDYGVARDDRRLVEFVKTKVRTHYLTRSACPLARVELEPREFMAVCSNWAWLVQSVLPPNEFNTWLARFLPDDLALHPITTPGNAHEVGLNFSRAWGWWRLYSATRNPRYAKLYLDHFNQTYDHPELWKGDYRSVAHWVAQFGMFALMVSYYDSKDP